MLKYANDIVVTNDGALFATTTDIGHHRLTGDEPHKAGGQDLGPTSHQFLLTALGQCIVITLRMYAHRKQWDVGKISVHLNMEHVNDPAQEKNIIYKKVFFEGNLTEEQQNRLLFIADRCPIHKLLTGTIEIRS